jgi:glycosyltransferase involved in cell wall biosynthesis
VRGDVRKHGAGPGAAGRFAVRGPDDARKSPRLSPESSGRDASANISALVPELTLLMPVYNELATIEAAIENVLEADYGVDDVELIVIDDGSGDGTRAKLETGDWDERVRVLYRTENGGKGAAIQTGLREAQGRYCAIIDADLEYSPADIAKLLEPLLAGEAEAVFGARGFASHSSYGFWYVIGNKAVTLAANVLYNSWISDIMTCHKVMPTELFRALDLREPGFGIEPEITARLLRAGVRIYEVPVSYRARSREEGKKLRAFDAVRVLWTLLRCRFGPATSYAPGQRG